MLHPLRNVIFYSNTHTVLNIIPSRLLLWNIPILCYCSEVEELLIINMGRFPF